MEISVKPLARDVNNARRFMAMDSNLYVDSGTDMDVELGGANEKVSAETIGLGEFGDLSAELQALSAINRIQRSIGSQTRITLHAENLREMVRALRFHPRYEHLSLKELLMIVRNRAGVSNAMTIKLQESLVPTFTAVLAAEGVGVEVTVQADAQARQ